MEQQWISELPEALLLHILSSLPTKTAVATSVLSKRWKSVWRMLPNLELVSRRHHQHICSERNVSRTLILLKAPVLESLDLSVRCECDASQLEVWIALALARHVRKLELTSCHSGDEGPVQFPDALCRFNDTLEFLKLKKSILLNLTAPVCLKSLRELHLCNVKFKDEESFSNLLCCCPCLEDLVVMRDCKANSSHTFTIAVPSLQRLNIVDHSDGQAEAFVINCPSLKHLKLQGDDDLRITLIEKVPKLVEARVWKIDNENILLSLTSAKFLALELRPSEIKYPSGIIFYRLLTLELCTFEEEWGNLLTLMLDSSPKLQSLKLFNYEHLEDNPKYPLDSWNWNQPKCVPECLLLHLETFEWHVYEWELEDEKEVATYILKNARCLKEATFITKPIDHPCDNSKKLRKLEKRRLLKLASDSCDFDFRTEKW